MEVNIIRVVVLIGPSGTGKSYQSIYLAKMKNIEYMIDDGLLIKGNKVIAGFSAKRENTIMGAVKRALFMDENHRKNVVSALSQEKPESILVLGTSEKMVEKIVGILGLGKIDEKVYIDEISTREEINTARRVRIKEGKHIIPVPTFEIKRDFSGYFLNPLKILKKRGYSHTEDLGEKSVVRPTFSYLGKYSISNRVIQDLIYYAANKVIGVYKVENLDIKYLETGIRIYLEVRIIYGNPIIPLMKCLQDQVKYEVEEMTSLNILGIDILVKKFAKL
ncbi:MAG: Asp23/Gls24 family envelope stress response protein [Clostridiales bacterium]|nr:Asp23/Gls24 family envelope stress response protein [Clostridiales bacterium]